MTDDHDVIQGGRDMDLGIHRSCSIVSYENGYVVKCQTGRKKAPDDDWCGQTKTLTRAFRNNIDLMEWLWSQIKHQTR